MTTDHEKFGMELGKALETLGNYLLGSGLVDGTKSTIRTETRCEILKMFAEATIRFYYMDEKMAMAKEALEGIDRLLALGTQPTEEELRKTLGGLTQ